eukprot:9126549-Heterocapsa_arctica.AAC.1
MSGYADDIARKVIFESVGQLHAITRSLDITVDAALMTEAPDQYKQNYNKKIIVPFVVGAGRGKKLKWLYDRAD